MKKKKKTWGTSHITLLDIHRRLLKCVHLNTLLWRQQISLFIFFPKAGSAAPSHCLYNLEIGHLVLSSCSEHQSPYGFLELTEVKVETKGVQSWQL